MSVVPHQASAKGPSSGSGSEWPPSWRTLPHGISVGRYIDPEFQKLEYEKLWSKAWQVAARVDEIPEVNDCTSTKSAINRCCWCRVDQTHDQGLSQCVPASGHCVGPVFRNASQADGSSARSTAGVGIRCGKNQFVLERKEFRGGQLARQRRRAQGSEVGRFCRFRLHQLRAESAIIRRIHRAGASAHRRSCDRRDASLLVEVAFHSERIGKWRRRRSSRRIT